MWCVNDLPGYDGSTAYGGALRFFDPTDDSWKSSWGGAFGVLQPDMRIFASDAFGVMYGLNEKNDVAIFWPETGEVENIGVDQEIFYSLIKQDPDGTISYDLYLQAEKALGSLDIYKNFAFVIELALGGQLSVENLTKMDSIEHMKMLGNIAQKLMDIPTGTKFDSVVIE